MPTKAQMRKDLMVYTALAEKDRFRAFSAVCETPNITFNALVKEIKIESGLMAYHLGILKAAGLIRRKEDGYFPSDKGREYLHNIRMETAKLRR